MFAAGGVAPDETEETRDEETRDEETRDEETREYEIPPEEAELELEDEAELEAVEDEAWDGDEYEEWEEEEEDGFAEPDETDEPETEPDAEQAGSGEPPDESDLTPGERIAGLREWCRGTADKGRAGAKRLWHRIVSIRLPRKEIDGRKVLAGAGVLVLALMIGTAGFFLGRGSGDDLDTARLQGEFEGRKAGAIEGASEGYAAGFKKGRDIAFRKSYEASYRRNYIRAYEEAGMDPPKAKDIEVPNP